MQCLKNSLHDFNNLRFPYIRATTYKNPNIENRNPYCFQGVSRKQIRMLKSPRDQPKPDDTEALHPVTSEKVRVVS
ncbi:MAG: hypothetical protein BA861_03635 [Desulfobacterales bacterium S3730MH5]|nr:MAG: hypothetical protein BA861_03635 [Desulfobacterales bacterium S3730MH5]